MSEEDDFVPDELEEGGVLYLYRDKSWTDERGMCVSITRSQQMTMQFYEQHGRMPREEPKPKPRPRANSRAAKAAKAKAAALRAAISKARAEKRDD
jgi:hypothetical protein